MSKPVLESAWKFTGCKEKETDKLASKTYSFTSTENFSILTIYVQTEKT
jgi:hypothetical protein